MKDKLIIWLGGWPDSTVERMESDYIDQLMVKERKIIELRDRLEYRRPKSERYGKKK